MIFSNSWHSRQLARCVLPMGAVLRGSDSQSETTNETKVHDMRVAGGNDSVNVSASEGATVTLTDHGAVAGGLDLASRAVDAVAKNGQTLQATTQSLYEGALDTVKSTTAQLANAWSESKSPDKNIVIAGAVAVVGVAALAIFAKKG